MQDLGGCERQRQHGDVVVLAEVLRGVGDGVGKLAECSRPAKRHEKRRDRLAHG
jgi:hypothetical protein